MKGGALWYNSATAVSRTEASDERLLRQLRTGHGLALPVGAEDDL